VKNVTMRFSMRCVISHNRVPFVIHQDFKLNAKLYDLLSIGNVIMPVTA